MLKTIDCKLLRKMFSGAAQNLEINKANINALNVFPVPDGDTGTNMSATIMSARREVESISEEELTFGALCEAVAKGSLRGARGNSGVILSQIFKGMCTVISELDTAELNLKDFSKALKEGAKIAYSAVSKPKEGTILTVIRVMAEQSQNLASGRNNTWEKFFESLIAEGYNILAQTPNMLPVLKKAGVVDAGGEGLMCVFDGFFKILKGEEISEISVKADKQANDAGFAADIHNLEDIEFAYCTEFFVTNIRARATEVDIDKLRDKLSKLGDSLIVIGDLHLVKVHVHTNTPGRALQAALELGEIDNVKIENMLEQNRKVKAEMGRRKKAIGVVSVCSGDGFTDMFNQLLVDVIIQGGQTMNPSVQEILSAVNRVNADTVLILPNNKNIILAAEQAKEISARNCIVIPTENMPSGIAAAIAFDPNADVDTNVNSMKEAYQRLKCGQVTTAVRTTRMDGLSLAKGDIIGLSEKKILCKGDDINNVAINLIKKLDADSVDVINIYYGADIDESQAEVLTDKLSSEYPRVEFITCKGGQPHAFYMLSAE